MCPELGFARWALRNSRASDGTMAEVNVRFYRPVRKEGIE